MKLSSFSGIALLIIVSMCLSGCAAKKQPRKIQANEFFKQMQEDFKRMKNPRASIKMMRNYAQEKLLNATDEELIFLEGTPMVKPNFDGTMYVFFWKRSFGKGIQVISTPPPCRPITVSRTRRPRFPDRRWWPRWDGRSGPRCAPRPGTSPRTRGRGAAARYR